MGFYEHLQTFAGKPVRDFESGAGWSDPAGTIPRLRVEFEANETAVDQFRELLETGTADQLFGLVVGAWSGTLYENSPAELVEALVAAADQLPSLRAIFLGDITGEENEVSWIHQADLSALWDAFPRLEVLGIRGSNGLSLGKIRHNHLRELVIECGGLGKDVLAQLAAASLPNLEHLELYLGTNDYGWDGAIADVQPLLAGTRFPRLKHLGLRDSEIADNVAKAVAQSPLLERLEVLDLSLGTLGDEGAEALLQAPAAKKLKRLQLNHHYMSDDAAKRVEQWGKAAGIRVDVSDHQEEEEYGRFVAVGE